MPIKAQEQLSTDELRRLTYDLQVHQLELEMQNEELRRSQAELEAARARYFELYDLAPVGYITLNQQGVITEANLTAASLLALPRQELLQHRFPQFILSEDKQNHYSHWQQLQETQSPRNWEIRLLLARNSAFWVHIQARPAANGEYRLTLHDINAKKEAEAGQRQDRARLQTILTLNQMINEPLEQIQKFIAEHSVHQSGSMMGFCGLLKGNQEIMNAYLWSEEALNKCAIQAKPFSGDPITFPLKDAGLWAEVVRNGEPVLSNDYAGPVPGKRGTPPGHVPLRRFLGVPIITDERCLGMIGLGNKIAEYNERDILHLRLLAEGISQVLRRRQNEEELRESEARYERAVNGANDGIWEWIPATGEDYLSPRWKQLLGYEDHELPNVQASFFDQIHPEDRPWVWAAIRTHFEKRKPYEIELRLRCKSGEYRWFSTRGQATFDGQGLPLRMSGSITDITENKHIEKTLVKRTTHLFERVKELNCLYNISKLIGDPPHPPPELFAQVVQLIPQGWYSPKAICARIIFAQQQFTTANFREGKGKYSAPIVVGEKTLGAVEIFLLEERLFAGNQFMPEEKSLVDELARRLSGVVKRKQVEDELRLHSEIMRNIVEGVYLVRLADGKIVYTNPCCEKMFGFQPGEMLGNEVVIVDLPQAKPPTELKKTIIDLLLAHGEWHGEVESIRKDGRHIWCAANMSLFSHPEYGQVIVGVYTDISDRKQNYEKLIQTEKLAAIGTLSASIAHEFNNPLQSVLNVIKGVQRWGGLAADDAKLMDIALDECHRMRNLIKNLQEFNRPSSSKVEPLEINTAIDNILLLTTKEYKTKKITINKEYGENLPPLNAVADQIKQVILNLLNNAVDACENGGRITIRTEADQELLVVQIEDTGSGISPANLDHIFEPFFSTKPAVKGTGLGLSVSYGIVKAHGGKIKVASELGKGSVFSIILPLAGGPLHYDEENSTR